jgi:hypothetical protein
MSFLDIQIEKIKDNTNILNIESLLDMLLYLFDSGEENLVLSFNERY